MAIQIEIEVEPNYITLLTGKIGRIVASHTTTNKDGSHRKEIYSCSFEVNTPLMPSFNGGIKKRLWYAVKRQAKILGWIKG